MIKDYEEGMTGKLMNEDLEDRWKSFKLDDRWSRSYESFLNNWKARLDNYETSRTKDLDDDERKRVLESAIRPKPELHACTANGELLSTLLSSLGVAADDLTFEPFLTMVMAHAKTLDKQNAAKKPTNRKNNKAN